MTGPSPSSDPRDFMAAFGAMLPSSFAAPTESGLTDALSAAALHMHIIDLIEKAGTDPGKVRDSTLGVIKIVVEPCTQSPNTDPEFAVTVSRLLSSQRHESVLEGVVTAENLASKLAAADLRTLHDSLKITPEQIDQFAPEVWKHRVKLVLDGCKRMAERSGAAAGDAVLNELRQKPIDLAALEQEFRALVAPAIETAESADRSISIPEFDPNQIRQLLRLNMQVALKNFSDTLAVQAKIIEFSPPERLKEIALTYIDTFAAKFGSIPDDEGDALRNAAKERNLSSLTDIFTKMGVLTSGAKLNFEMLGNDQRIGTADSMVHRYADLTLSEAFAPVIKNLSSMEVEAPAPVSLDALGNSLLSGLAVEILRNQSDVMGDGLTPLNLRISFEKLDPLKLKGMMLDYLSGGIAALNRLAGELAPVPA